MRRLVCWIIGHIWYWRIDPPKFGQPTIWGRPWCIRCREHGNRRPLA